MSQPSLDQRHRYKNGQISKKHGWQYSDRHFAEGLLRKVYGLGFGRR